ncbi:MAG: hypothetical protein R6U32_07775 [Candidatus Woesearchaeota archaeon]
MRRIINRMHRSGRDPVGISSIDADLSSSDGSMIEDDLELRLRTPVDFSQSSGRRISDPFIRIASSLSGRPIERYSNAGETEYNCFIKGYHTGHITYWIDRKKETVMVRRAFPFERVKDYSNLRGQAIGLWFIREGFCRLRDGGDDESQVITGDYMVKASPPIARIDVRKIMTENGFPKGTIYRVDEAVQILDDYLEEKGYSRSDGRDRRD